MPEQRSRLITSNLYLHRKTVKLTHNNIVGGANEAAHLLSASQKQQDQEYLQSLTDDQLRREQRKRLDMVRNAQKTFASKQRAQARAREARIVQDAEHRMRQTEARVLRDVQQRLQAVAQGADRAIEGEENRIK